MEFPYLNKVGMSSQPNAIALLLGKLSWCVNLRFVLGAQSDNMLRNPCDDGNTNGRDDEICNRPISNENFIGFDFQKAGY
jgi:hypothetical protein